MDTQILEDIGLTNAEIKVYLALLELGSATAGPIIEKRLISFVKEGKRNRYQASNPKHIVEYIDEKKERFEQILPDLLKKQKISKEKPEIITFKGIKGVKELLLELLDAGGTEHH